MQSLPEFHQWLWGKAGKPEDKKDPPYHPALLHMLDVAVVAEALLATGIGRMFDFQRDAVGNFVRWLVFIVALHDVGKISPGFQKKRNDLEAFGNLPPKDFPVSSIDDPDHGRVTLATLPDILVEKTGCPKTVAVALSRTVGAHHGRFHGSVKPAGSGDKKWVEARWSLVEALREALGLAWADFPFRDSSEFATPFLMKLAGLTCLADWIGSAENYFPYEGDHPWNLSDYVADRRERAKRAVSELRFDAEPLPPGVSHLDELFHYKDKFIANGCQRLATDIARRFEGPTLLVIEVPMGWGKTEAALGVADFWIRERSARGLYFALPTQATSNQMFKRVLAFLKKHQASKQEVELHLLHANAGVNEAYEELQTSAVFDDDDPHRGVRASEWFTARKRGLLAPFAVGTIDQILLGALQSRHMFVRLFGLAGKVVVIDEVHAYDAYTSEILFRLLNWLSALGTSVVLLSATLPDQTRRKLVKAFAPTLKDDEVPLSCYPGILAVGRDEAPISGFVPVLDEDRRSIGFELHPVAAKQKWDTVKEQLQHQLRGGGCAACIVNTVFEAQELFRKLKNELTFDGTTEFILFHARFPLGRRLEIEKIIEGSFGREATLENGKRPKRAVVVATQVLEQSLDVDFDLMFTDLAPIDLILQRAGRLRRHPERTRLLTGKLHCLTPPKVDETPDFGISGIIYEPYVLLRTALTIQSLNGKSIALPEGLAELVENVYGPEGIAIPEDVAELHDTWKIELNQKNRFTGFAARDVMLFEPKPNGSDAILLSAVSERVDEEVTPPAMTRLARPSVHLILVYEKDGKSFLDAGCTRPLDFKVPPGKARTRVILLNGVSISAPHWVGFFKDQPEITAWEKNPQLKFVKVAKLRNGRLIAGGREIVVTEELGVEFSNQDE